MNEEEAKKKISEILFKALTSKEEITVEKDKEIKAEIIDVLGQVEKKKC